IDVLRKHGASTTDVLRIFGTEAGPAMAALLERGTAGVRETEAALGDVKGRADQVVGTLQGRGVDATVKFADAWDRVTAALAESGVLDALNTVVRGVGRLVDKFERLDPTTKTWIVTAGGIAA